MQHWLNVIPTLLFKAANDGRSNSDGETPDKLGTFNKLMLIDSWKAFSFTIAVRFNMTIRIDFHQSAYFGKCCHSDHQSATMGGVTDFHNTFLMCPSQHMLLSNPFSRFSCPISLFSNLFTLFSIL